MYTYKPTCQSILAGFIKVKSNIDQGNIESTTCIHYVKVNPIFLL